MALASSFDLVHLITQVRVGSRPRDNYPGCPKDPANVGNERPVLEIGEVYFRFGRKQDLSIVLHRRNSGGVEFAFIPEQDLTRPKQAWLVVVNLLEPVAEAIGKGKRLGPWAYERH